mmetsp:Transcript_43057/g.82540  ORF Transcript_43057/g.82540 Transcript_43057/m.82540 type:complete len:382 (+) Transcript_43057:63-1208(+)
MAGKDSRNHRHGRRGPRGGQAGASGSTTASVADAAAASTSQASARSDLVEEEHRLASKKASALEALPRPSTHNLLTMVPTPVRSPKSSSEDMGTSLENSPASKQGGNVEANVFYMPQHGDRSPSSATGSALGPEPWGLPDASLPPVLQPGAKAGYREWLQARGQLAMQRSLGGNARNQPSSAAAGQASPVPAQLQLATAAPGPSSPVSWGNMQGDMQLQWFSTPAPTPEMSPVAAGTGQSSALGFGVCNQSPLMLPGCPQTPVGYGCPQQTSMPTMSSGPPSAPVYGPQTPVGSPLAASHMAFAGCPPSTPVSNHPSAAHFSFFPQGPETAIAAQQELVPPQESCEQEQLMAAVLPDDFSGLDKETIAQRLRAAAPCSYDD